MKKRDNWYKADKGKYFVLTEKGKRECASWKHEEVGKPVDSDETYAPLWAVENGMLIEVDDPDWVTLPGYMVVYNHKGYELSVGNARVFPDREMAEKYMNGYKIMHPWFTEKVYIVDAIYEGEKPKPCGEFESKRVYSQDYWTYEGAKVGDWVEDTIVDYAINAVPPVYMRSYCMQCGEPANHKIDEKTGESRAVYYTFKKIAEGIYEYCGRCFAGENVERGKEIPII